MTKSPNCTSFILVPHFSNQSTLIHYLFILESISSCFTNLNMPLLLHSTCFYISPDISNSILCKIMDGRMLLFRAIVTFLFTTDHIPCINHSHPLSFYQYLHVLKCFPFPIFTKHSPKVYKLIYLLYFFSFMYLNNFQLLFHFMYQL